MNDLQLTKRVYIILPSAFVQKFSHVSLIVMQYSDSDNDDFIKQFTKFKLQMPKKTFAFFLNRRISILLLLFQKLKESVIRTRPCTV